MKHTVVQSVSKKKLKKQSVFSLCHSQATYECPQKKIQPIRFSSLAGYREQIYECLVSIYVIKKINEIKIVSE